jgi:hypothetical protein
VALAKYFKIQNLWLNLPIKITKTVDLIPHNRYNIKQYMDPYMDPSDITCGIAWIAPHAQALFIVQYVRFQVQVIASKDFYGQ